MFAVVYKYARVPPMPPGRLAAPLVSMVFTEPPPPEPSISRIIGRRKSCAISSAISGFAEIEASAEPPRTVKSSPTTTTVRPSILPRPNTQFAGVKFLSSPFSSYSALPEIAPISWKLFRSTSLSMRSRTVSRPWSRCRLTLSTPPISRAKASRRARASRSGFQVIYFLRPDLVLAARYRKRLVLHAIAEQSGLAALEHDSDRRTQLQKPRGDLLVQPLLIIHCGQKTDRDDDIGLVLRRPQRHRETIDMRAPQPAGHDIASFAHKSTVGLQARPQQPGLLRHFALHFRKQGVTDLGIECGGIGMARGGACHRDATACRRAKTERVGGTADLKIDQMKAVRNDEADRAGQLLGDLLQPQPDQVAQLLAPHHRGAHRDRAWTNAVFLVAGQIDQLAHPRQRVGQPRYRRARQPAAVGDFQITKPRFMALETAQHVKRARHHLDHIAL